MALAIEAIIQRPPQHLPQIQIYANLSMNIFIAS